MTLSRISGKEICDPLTMSVMNLGVGSRQVCQAICHHWYRRDFAQKWYFILDSWKKCVIKGPVTRVTV